MKFSTVFSADGDSSKRGRLRQLNKQLRGLKEKMEELEFNFEVKHGYKPSLVSYHSMLLQPNGIFSQHLLYLN